MIAMLDPPEIGLILIVVLVLFGGSQLPKLAKNIGKAQKEFKDGLAEGQKEANQSPAQVAPAPQPAPTPQPQAAPVEQPNPPAGN
jgi:sec-independent protein translocase protein TatA